MSHYKRGVVDGVTHYCDQGWWARKEDVDAHGGKQRSMHLFPWCVGTRRDGPVATETTKRALVTCLQCMWLRKKRP